MISGPWTAYLIAIFMRCVFSVMDLHKFTCMHFVYALYVRYRSQHSTISEPKCYFLRFRFVGYHYHLMDFKTHFVHVVCMDMLQDNA